MADANRDLVEQLAHIEHERWSRWMRHLFTKGHRNADGSFTIDAESVSRWSRQVQAPYPELSEQEKESDRAEARKTLRALGLME